MRSSRSSVAGRRSRIRSAVQWSSGTARARTPASLPSTAYQPTLEKYGGRFVVAGGQFEVIEGDWTPRLVVVHQWPSRAAFKEWYASDEYRPWKAKRHAASAANVILVDGLAPMAPQGE